MMMVTNRLSMTLGMNIWKTTKKTMPKTGEQYSTQLAGIHYIIHDVVPVLPCAGLEQSNQRVPQVTEVPNIINYLTLHHVLKERVT